MHYSGWIYLASCPCENGICLTIQEIYSLAGQEYYDFYSLWDASATTACVCDLGYTGATCSMRECPRGIDPLSIPPNITTAG